METHFLRKVSLAVILTLFTLCSYAQDAAVSSCNNPAGGCDTIGIEKKISPWRVGGFLGPAAAFCGTWAGTFNSDKYRDKSLFNGIGFHAALNADYYFKPEQKKQFKFGLGAMAGLQLFFLRKDVDTFIDRIVGESGYSNAVVRKGSSEDHYLVAGPVITYAFGKKARSPYLEASVRGGVFRTTPAAIFVYDQATGNNIYSVTATDRRYHPGLLATLGFFVPSKNGLWSWGVEATGFRTKVDYIFPGATIYPFERKHGGFTAGLAMRRNFVRDVPVKKDPTPALICVAPELELKMGEKSIKGLAFNTSGADAPVGEPIMLTWKSRSTPDTTKTETFTARIHQLNGGEDKVIASVICQEGNQLAFPKEYLDAKGLPVTGQYYVTVHSQQVSNCASCTSEASSTGFTVNQARIDTVSKEACYKQCYLEVYAYKTVNAKRVVYGKSPTSCVGCICPVDTVSKKVSKYYLLGTVELKDCDPATLDINEQISKNNIKIPAWATTVYTAVQTTVAGNCPDLPQGINKVNYKTTARKGKLGTFTKVEEKKKKK